MATPEELRDRVTGRPKPAPAAVPASPAIVGPASAPTAGGRKLSPYEVKQLEDLGWDGKTALPENLADGLAEFSKRSGGRQPDRAEFKALIAGLAESVLREQTAAAVAAAVPPNVREAVSAANRAADATADFWQVTDDGAVGKSAEPAAAPDEPPAAQPPADVSAAEPRRVCPHCNWDLQRNDVPDATEGDKDAFVSAMLGGKPFFKEYGLFGNRLIARFRTLRRREGDAVWGAAVQAAKDNQHSDFEVEQSVVHNRLYLQLVLLRSEELSQSFPEGFDKASCPDAAITWADRVPVAGLHAGTSEYNKFMFEGIERELTNTAITHETVLRVLDETCRKFNRLVSLLERRADDPNFYQPIAR